MGLEQELEKLIKQKTIERCELCHGRMEYTGGGKYRCKSCNAEALDDFGKIKQYLDENGPTPEAIIAHETGISMEKIDSYLRKGMVEITDGSKYYLKCEKCGAFIRCGRYCPECARVEIKKSLKMSYEDIGERPKKVSDSDVSGKMHFLTKKGKNNIG